MIEALPTGQFQDQARAEARAIMLDTFSAVEAVAQADGRTALPISARAQVENWLAEYAGRFTGGFENAADSCLNSIESVQALPVFPAFLSCLLDQDWPIPGLSKWGSRAAKKFLQSIARDNFWTQHVYVAAGLTDGHQDKIDTSSIERTTWEDRTLLFTVQDLDHWLLVEDGGTHRMYWPCLFLVGCIGTHIHNGTYTAHKRTLT